MSELQLLIDTLDEAHRRTHLYTRGMTSEQAFWRPKPEMAHPAWHLGHIAFVKRSAILGYIKGDFSYEDDRSLFGTGSTAKDADAYPPFERIVADYDKAHADCMSYVHTWSDMDLGKRAEFASEMVKKFVPNPTRRNLLVRLPLHEALHTGLIWLVRRLSGTPRMF